MIKLSEIGKSNISQEKIAEPKKSTKNTTINFRFSVSPFAILWVVFGIVIAIEIFIIYNYLVRNIQFEELSGEAIETAIVRIDFDQYEKVIERLDEVEDYQVSRIIDFETSQTIGRSNPFSEP